MKADGSNETRLTNNTDSDTQPSSQRLVEVETVGVYRPSTGQWFLDTSDLPHNLNIILTFGGQPGDLPVAGDWNGDNQTDIGVFRNGTFHLALLKKGTGMQSAECVLPHQCRRRGWRRRDRGLSPRKRPCK